jgi:branched-chain amino acid transport system ATP-binding protein
MLSLSRWSAGYGGTRIVDDVTLDIPDGELVALLGRNGMGKTTLLRSIFGLATTMGGSLRLDDADLPARPEALARRGFTLLPDDRGVFPTLTVEENLDLARRRGYTPTVDVLSLFPLLTDRARQAGRSSSSDLLAQSLPAAGSSRSTSSVRGCSRASPRRHSPHCARLRRAGSAF